MFGPNCKSRILPRASSPLKLYIFAVILFTLISSSTPCGVELCSREYAELVANQAILKQEHNRRHKNSPSHAVQVRSNAEYCGLLHAYHHCMRTLSKPCRGNLEYHSVQTLVRTWLEQNNCSAAPKTKHIGSKPGSNLSELRRQNAIRSEKEGKRRLKNCLREALNYTLDQDAYRSRIKKRKNPDKWSSEESPLNYASRISRDVDSVEEEDDVEAESGEEDTHETHVDGKEFVIEEDILPESQLMCLIYGDPHLRTLTRKYQTCRCHGAWPLIDHPLFVVQITNSDFRNRMQSTGITKVTVIVREFRKCDITNDMTYEAETDDKSSVLSHTFTDGLTSSYNNLVYIEAVSQDVVAIKLSHIGVNIIISQSKDSDFLNVIVKFDDSLDGKLQKQIIAAITDRSLCKSGCPPKERVQVMSLLEAIGLNLDEAINDELNSSKSNSTSADPCFGLYGYYRISCLYDVKMKGISGEDAGLHRLVQSHDDASVVKRSFVDSFHSDGGISLSSVRSNGSPLVVSCIYCIIAMFFIATSFKQVVCL
ncbi:Repulsive guidance molecule B [Halotydeus destructor]|nr:Repulsive guidance molecule B [Halotydeus destructor]